LLLLLLPLLSVYFFSNSSSPQPLNFSLLSNQPTRLLLLFIFIIAIIIFITYLLLWSRKIDGWKLRLYFRMMVLNQLSCYYFIYLDVTNSLISNRFIVIGKVQHAMVRFVVLTWLYLTLTFLTFLFYFRFNCL
jgi:hypothetical protein